MTEFRTDRLLNPQAATELARQSALVEKAKSLANRSVSSDKDVEKAISGFEALMLHQLLKEMWRTVDFTGMFGGDSNEASIYRDMLNQALADSIAEGKGVGIKDFLRKELDKADKASKG